MQLWYCTGSNDKILHKNSYTCKELENRRLFQIRLISSKKKWLFLWIESVIWVDFFQDFQSFMHTVFFLQVQKCLWKFPYLGWQFNLFLTGRMAKFQLSTQTCLIRLSATLCQEYENCHNLGEWGEKSTQLLFATYRYGLLTLSFLTSNPS